MKRSDTPTDFILIKALTNSEWDSVSFALLELTEPTLRLFEKGIKAVAPFKDDFSFYHLAYWDGPDGWYKESDEAEAEAEAAGDVFIDMEEDWIYVDMEGQTAETISNPKPENRIDSEQLQFFNDGGRAKYKAYGKHTSEEFWTEDFNVTKILADRKKEVTHE